jgi:DNA replication protein DnaC
MVDNPLAHYQDFEKIKLFRTLLASDMRYSKKNWFFIQGPSGTGKTYLAVLAAQLAILDEKSVYFVPVVDLMLNLRPGEVSDKNIMNHVRKSYLLILDDLGKERWSDWVVEQLFLIINHRWNEGLPTIITSNHSIKEFSDSADKTVVATFSRIEQYSTVLDIVGEDRRKIK